MKMHFSYIVCFVWMTFIFLGNFSFLKKSWHSFVVCIHNYIQYILYLLCKQCWCNQSNIFILLFQNHSPIWSMLIDIDLMKKLTIHETKMFMYSEWKKNSYAMVLCMFTYSKYGVLMKCKSITTQNAFHLRYKYNVKLDPDFVPWFMNADIQFNVWIECKTGPWFCACLYKYVCEITELE